jgi:hypothetical protein
MPPGRGELKGFGAYKFSLFDAGWAAACDEFMKPKESAGGVGGAMCAAVPAAARCCSQLCGKSEMTEAHDGWLADKATNKKKRKRTKPAAERT